MGTIRFELNNDKTKIDKDGKSPIRLFYQIAGQRKAYSTGEKVFKENWSQQDQQAIYIDKRRKLLSAADVKAINDNLSDLKRDIEKIQTRFEANNESYTVSTVLEALKQKDAPVAKKESYSKELYSFIDQYIKNNSFTRVKGSLSVYKSLKNHLQNYEKQTGKPVTFDKINYAFFESFRDYLASLTEEITDKETKKKKRVKLLNNITIAKLLSTLKTFLNYARKHEIKVPDIKFKIEKDNDLEVIALTQSEFDALYKMDLSKRPAWDRVRDLFIFSCVTSYRFSDLQQLAWHHIHFDKGYIQLRAIKTGHLNKVPLNPISIKILKKYDGETKPLPEITNQRANEHLEKICDWAGINSEIEIVRKHGAQRDVKKYKKYELIRMHCGRKTFATLSLEKGMPVEVVMQIGGWKSYASFKRYLNITDDRAITAMQNSWGAKVIKPKLKAV